MSARTGVSLGLIGFAWLALVAALIAVPFTPSSYCNELGEPAGLTASTVALVVAGVAALGAIPVGGWGDRALRTAVIVVALALATMFAVAAVGFVVDRHVTSTGCG